MCAWEGGKWDGSPGAHVSRDTSWQGSDLGTTNASASVSESQARNQNQPSRLPISRGFS